MNRIRTINLVLFCYWVVLFSLTHIPMSLRTGIRINHLDKIFHLGAYAALAFLLGWVMSQDRQISRANNLFVFAITAIYAIADEWTQRFIPGRFPDFWDAVADIVGAIFGLIALAILFHVLRVGSTSLTVRENEA